MESEQELSVDIWGLDSRELYSNLDDLIYYPSNAEDFVDAECTILRWLGGAEIRRD